MLTQHEVEQINSSFRTALADLNKNARVPYLDNKRNFATAATYLRREQVDQGSWVHVQIWRSALLATQDQLETAVVKSREQKEQERRAADSAAGRQRYIKNDDGHTTTDGFADLAEKAKKSLQNLFNPEPETPVQEKVQFPPYNKDIQDQTPDNQRLFRSLSAADMKKWMAHRAVVKHRQEHNLDAVQE